MEIQRPHHQTLTPEEQQHLERLRRVIEQAAADGKLTQFEVAQIKAIVWENGKVSPEEMQMVSELVSAKVAAGELAIEW